MEHRPHIPFHYLRVQQLATCHIIHAFKISNFTTNTYINFVFVSSLDFICDENYGLKFIRCCKWRASWTR